IREEKTLNNYNSSRRDFIKSAVFGSAGVSLIPLLNINPFVKTLKKRNLNFHLKEYIKLGIATYSLRKFSRDEAIKMIKECRVPYVCIKSFHLPYNDTPEELNAGRLAFEKAGLKIVGGGVIYLKENNDESIKKYFDYAKTCGMPLMVIGPVPETLPRIEKFVKKYNIKVAIHNHGPEDPYFPGPADILKAINGMDPRVGVCIDVGHTARTGVDVVKSIAETGERLLDMHIKDLKDLKDKNSQCAVGEGKMPIPEIFKTLKKINYKGYVNLEYEINPDNPLSGMKESFAYMRGVLAGLGY
ncbi:sugar phosphate isomerase/epimerase, partial [candidate division KSB1 bacterium]